MLMTSKEMAKYFEQNGFVKVRSNGSHAFYKNEKTGRTTTVPIHACDLKKGTESKILKDAGLPRP